MVWCLETLEKLNDEAEDREIRKREALKEEFRKEIEAEARRDYDIFQSVLEGRKK